MFGEPLVRTRVVGKWTDAQMAPIICNLISVVLLVTTPPADVWTVTENAMATSRRPKNRGVGCGGIADVRAQRNGYPAAGFDLAERMVTMLIPSTWLLPTSRYDSFGGQLERKEETWVNQSAPTILNANANEFTHPSCNSGPDLSSINRISRS